MTRSAGEPAHSPELSGQDETGYNPHNAERPGAALPTTDPAQHTANPWQNLPPPPSDAELVRLRELLFTRELTLLDKLRVALSEKQHTTRKVSEVLAEAFVLRSGKDTQLNMALEPLVDEILKTTLRKRQGDLVNALFPLMGPSIRKSIAETFRSMLDSFSKSMEMAFSWQGLRWRFEAWRSGKPFSEIVLLHTLIYRVEQVFFIHSETGIVLSHMTNEGVGSQDADMVSAMLTAIQDFVRDCFTSGNQGELEFLNLGEVTIYIEKSPQAYLACVVRGTPPADFRVQLRSALELMLVEFIDPLAEFDGDTAPFEHAARYLDGLLLSRFVGEEKPLPLWVKLVPILLFVLIASWIGISYYTTSQFTSSMQRAVRALRKEPGLMVVYVDEQTLPWQVFTFKDNLARDPKTALRELNFDPEKFVFRTVPFVSYDVSIITQRAENSIELPKGVTMDFDGKGSLVFKGIAPMSWIVKANDIARALPGVERVDTSGVQDPKTEQITSLVKEIEKTIVEFPSGKDVPIPEDIPKLKKVVDALVELEKLTRTMGFTVTLTIYGHADTTGLEKRNYELSQARTRTVAAMLYSRGSSMPISMYGMGSQYPKGGEAEALGKADQTSRRIELRVHLARSASADTDLMMQYFLQHTPR